MRSPEQVQPTWSERDLPPLPPAARNGWAHLNANSMLIHGIGLPRELEEILEHYNPTKPSELTSLNSFVNARTTQTAASSFFSAVEPTLHSFVATQAPQTALSTYYRALGHPRFVDTCTLVAESPGMFECVSVIVLEAQEIAELDVLDRTLRGDTAGALATTRLMIRAHWDSASWSRGLLSATNGLKMTKRSLALALLVVKRAKSVGNTRDVADELRDLNLEVSSLDPNTLRLERAVIAEAIYVTSRLAGVSRDFSFRPSWYRKLVFDRADTQTRINDYFRELIGYVSARRSSRPDPPVLALGTHPLWWLNNASGKVFLDDVVAEEPYWSELRNERDGVLAERHRLLDALRNQPR